RSMAQLLSPNEKPFDVLAEGLISKNNRGDWIRTSDLLNPFSGSRPLPAAELHKCKPSGDLQISLFTHFTQITAENQRIVHIFQAFPCPSPHPGREPGEGPSGSAAGFPTARRSRVGRPLAPPAPPRLAGVLLPGALGRWAPRGAGGMRLPWA